MYDHYLIYNITLQPVAPVAVAGVLYLMGSLMAGSSVLAASSLSLACSLMAGLSVVAASSLSLMPVAFDHVIKS